MSESIEEIYARKKQQLDIANQSIRLNRDILLLMLKQKEVTQVTDNNQSTDD
jgi:predicted CopG family antitoxin